MKIRVTVFADTEVPEVLFCPGNRAVSADAGSASSTTATWADPIAVDNVDVLSITRVAGPASGGAFPIGAYQSGPFPFHPRPLLCDNINDPLRPMANRRHTGALSHSGHVLERG